MIARMNKLFRNLNLDRGVWIGPAVVIVVVFVIPLIVGAIDLPGPSWLTDEFNRLCCKRAGIPLDD